MAFDTARDAAFFFNQNHDNAKMHRSLGPSTLPYLVYHQMPIHAHPSPFAARAFFLLRFALVALRSWLIRLTTEVVAVFSPSRIFCSRRILQNPNANGNCKLIHTLTLSSVHFYRPLVIYPSAWNFNQSIRDISFKNTSLGENAQT